MREFKNPTYDGPDCVCCKSKITKERERIVKILTEHKPTNETSSGLLAGCSCGEFVDDLDEHLVSFINKN